MKPAVTAAGEALEWGGWLGSTRRPYLYGAFAAVLLAVIFGAGWLGYALARQEETASAIIGGALVLLLALAVCFAGWLARQVRRLINAHRQALVEARTLIANLDNLPAPVFTVDRQLRITYINPAAVAATSLSRDECLGVTCASLFLTPICHSRQCPAAQVLAQGGTVRGENVVDPDSLDLPVRYTAAAITGGDGQVQGAVIHLADISQRLEVIEQMQRQEWLRDGQVQLADAMRGQQGVAELCTNLLRFLLRYLGAVVGVAYLAEDEGLRRVAAVGTAPGWQGPERIRVGEGICGTAVLEEGLVVRDDLPEDYLPVGSGSGRTGRVTVAALPLMAEGACQGVVELATTKGFSEMDRQFLRQVAEYVAIGVAAARARSRLQELLAESETQRAELEEQRAELARANQALESQARELARASRYKSEFLANMSHELRTPLNSMLLLSRTLAENREHNLTPRQVEFARTILRAGTGLLALIDDILDLSRIEAGKVVLRRQPLAVADLVEELEAIFRQQATEQGVDLSLAVAEQVPPWIVSDPVRLAQILKNFLANGLKFTRRGRVALTVERRAAADGAPLLAFVVSDTGIGIPADELEAIFTPFHQVDGSTSRSFGGTGLGLSICRRLAEALGGTIEVASEEGRGSVFTLLLPLEEASVPRKTTPAEATATGGGSLAGRRVLLAVAGGREFFRYAAALESAGATVVPARTAEEVAPALAGDPVDLAVVDPESAVAGDQEVGAALDRAAVPCLYLGAAVPPAWSGVAEAAGSPPVTTARLVTCLAGLLAGKAARDEVRRGEAN